MQASLVIPIKQLTDAKQRLSRMLDASQRQALCQAMLEDVLEVSATCDLIDQIVVVTSDLQVSAVAESYGARILPEPESQGLINAVTYAAEVLASEGTQTMIFLPGDTPLVSVEELEVVLGGATNTGENEFIIVPATDLGGSNCLVCSPPNCLSFQFGENSYRLHVEEARSRKIEPTVLRLPGIGLDVDTPEDFEDLVSAVLEQNGESNTYRYLVSQGFLHIEPAAELATAGEEQR